MRQWMTEERETLIRSRLEAHGCPTPSETGLRCADLVERLVGGLHHVYGAKGAEGVDWTNHNFVKVLVQPGMATYDYATLTRAVLLGHELAIRVEVVPAGRGLALMLHPRIPDDRSPESCMTMHHPTVAQMVAHWDGLAWVRELRAHKAAQKGGA